MDVLEILILSAFVLIPFLGIMAAIAVVSYQGKLASGLNYLKSYKTNHLRERIEEKTSVVFILLILIAVIVICFLDALIGIMVWKYLIAPLSS